MPCHLQALALAGAAWIVATEAVISNSWQGSSHRFGSKPWFAQVPVVWKRNLGGVFTSIVFSCIFSTPVNVDQLTIMFLWGESTNEFFVFQILAWGNQISFIYCPSLTDMSGWVQTHWNQWVGEFQGRWSLKPTRLHPQDAVQCEQRTCLPDDTTQNPPICYKSGNLGGDENSWWLRLKDNEGDIGWLRGLHLILWLKFHGSFGCLWVIPYGKPMWGNKQKAHTGWCSIGIVGIIWVYSPVLR